ncbi:DUF7344 domain-containing protein [Haloarcula laminariae]|uniref:DUF7344 domain-containing protein n=1 Tax=Haloarcula laminariae TaxID=2961577 RepID=UPI002404D752|nr:hypothetical protein [Halomicroarcula sp. FL173]
MNDASLQQTTGISYDDAGTAAITTHGRHKLLSDERRHTALRVLDEGPLPMGLGELADAVATDEAADADAVGVALHHKHLPLMADLGVVDYDPATRRVSGPR